MAQVQGHAMSGTGNDDTSIDKKMSCTIVLTSSPMHDEDARNRSRRVSKLKDTLCTCSLGIDSQAILFVPWMMSLSVESGATQGCSLPDRASSCPKVSAIETSISSGLSRGPSTMD